MKKEVNKYCTDLEIEGYLRKPYLFQILLLNDDFTPMEFVVSTLEKFFGMERHKAIKIMLEAHIKGRAAFGLFTRDIAASKVSQIVDYSKVHKHPLICSMEVAQ